jgi:hypothetical protein
VSEAVAWFDPDIVSKALILRWLTERLGELARHEVRVTPWGLDGGSSAAASIPVAGSIVVFAIPDAEKLAMRAQQQAKHATAPAGVAPEVVGGYGDGLDPGATMRCKPLYPYPPGYRRPSMPTGVLVLIAA